MPDTLSLATGVSLGLLAGIVSGVCYLFANGLVKKKPNHRKHKRCLPSGDEEVCRSCGGDLRGGCIPCICQHHRPVKFESGAWFLQQVQRALSLMPWSTSSEKLEQIDEEECEGCESPGPSRASGELRNVREFLETLSATLAGGPLEGTPVSSLYNHPAYLPPRHAPRASSAHQSSGASGAHAQLKRLVARVVEEAASLPALARYAAEPTTPSIESSTYEDLLATAILNKVIERYQTENGSGGRSSGIHSASASPTPSERSSPRSLNSRHRDITPPLQEEDEVSDWEEGEATVSDEALDLPRRVPFPEFGGDIVHASDNADREFDEVSCSDIQAVDGTWEENWLFQKKKIKSLQSVPVPMLVPNSNTEYRVLIGDRDADDTTDLSDNASDGDGEAEYKSDVKRVLDSRHVIGGKPKIENLLDYEPDSLTILQNDIKKEETVEAVNNEIAEKIENNFDSLENVNESVLVLDIESGPLTKAEFALKEEIHRTLFNGNVEDIVPEINGHLNGHDKDEVDSVPVNKGSISTLSRHEREGEYEEAVTVPVQRYADSLRRKHFDDEPQQIPTRDTDKEEDLIPGTVAYRERKKWENAVEMPNNPYSPEAIQRRLTAKSASSLFDMITTSKDVDDDLSIKSEDILERRGKKNKNEEKTECVPSLTNNMDSANMNGTSKSPSPRILKDVLADEVPQYKRYGRDYYIREAKASSGGRKKSNSETSSLSSMNKSTSLDNFDTEYTSPVSASSSLSDLEASALHQNIVRAVLSPRNASPNFAINPIFENPDKRNDIADENHATDENGLLIKQFNTIASNRQYTSFPNETHESITTLPNNKTEILIEYDDITEQTLFAAKPAFVDDDTDNKFEEILQTAYHTETSIKDELKSPTNLSMDTSYISSSSMDDSIKIYNVPSGEIVKSKTDNKDKISVNCDVVDGNDNDLIDKNILENRVSPISTDSVVDESLVIVDNLDSLKEEKDNLSEIEDILPQLPKVKELAKKFVSMEDLNEPTMSPHQYWRRKSKDTLNDTKTDSKLYAHSITARSISKQFREELKLSMATPLTVPGGSKEIPEGTEEITKESSRPGSPVPEPGTIKNRLAFFESLKSKFNSK
ncbi:uncharacterized protein LOC113230412 isoform X2 [Hyposmocoma kahamanoa]|uniref:uncharacterized protein LOC113230412 isoform X2 n=1 Tax=Hyposmocoma kahamanoa TaxID=1477025 RepID=UPI000E6D9BC5|nr:uncharacterized protein LOC113230412 isoform X2 [Hyposmocoma kahamanoa]